MLFSNIFLLTLLTYFFATAEGKRDLPTCKLTDKNCLNKLVSLMIEDIYEGVPELDIKAIDPMYFDHIEGDLQFLQYHLYNSTMTGFKTCVFKNIEFDYSALKFYVQVSCPSGCRLVGDYKGDGKLFSFNLGGKGDFDFLLGAFDASIDADCEMKEADDGKIYIKVKNFVANAKHTSPFVAEFNNLFNGNKALSDAIHQVGHENWEFFTELVQEPLLWGIYKQIFQSVNTYLKTVHFEKP